VAGVALTFSWLFAAWSTLALPPPAAATEDLAMRVVILANASDPESVQLAHAYAALRAIPVANIVALPLSSAETIAWSEFVETLHRPLQAELLRRGWLDGIAMDLVDEAGRRKVAVSSHRISYLVVCRGVPLALAHEPAFAILPVLPRNLAQFRTSAGAIDGQLSLLARPAVSPNGWVPNPLFGITRSESGLASSLVIKVARLDGPTAAQALGLVEDALAVERDGLVGRAYVDLGGPEPDGDRWLEATVDLMGGLGYQVTVDREPHTLNAESGAGDAALYFGWYAPEINGPFAVPGYRFARGAIALHIHSMSAVSLRSEHSGGWVGPLVARGVAATFGNVGEPFLELTHRPDLLMRALARGDNLGDAACYALPSLGWQCIVVGDPLYRPFRLR
jgi:uncharacterized protein (TIGR03790 family)